MALVLTSVQDLEGAQRQLLSAPEQLTHQQLATILQETQQAIANKAFFLYGGFAGGEVELDAEGRPRFFRQGATVTEWTGKPAITCDGAALDQDLMIDWQQDGNRWNAAPRVATDHEPSAQLFTLWQVDIREVQDAGFKQVGDMRLRGLSFPYTAPSGAQFEAHRQALWFDPRTLLPVRWELLLERPEPMQYGYFLAYAPGLHLGPPASVQRPTCVPTRGRRATGAAVIPR